MRRRSHGRAGPCTWAMLAATAAAALLVRGVGAETVTLRDGKTVEGEIIRTNAASITLRTRSGVQTYRLDELAEPPGQAPDADAAVGQSTGAVAASPRPFDGPDRGWPADMRGFFLRGILTAQAGRVVWLLGSVLLIVQGFRTSLLWGLAVLLTNVLGALVFAVFHPRRAILSLLIMLAGIVIFAMAPFWAVWGAGMR